MSNYWCRYCGTTIVPKPGTLPFLEDANAYLTALGQQPFAEKEPLVCPHCYPKWQAELRDYAAAQVADAIEAARQRRERDVHTAPPGHWSNRGEDE